MDKEKTEDNLIYNIITNTRPDILFGYSLIMIIILLIFSNIELPNNSIFAIFIGFIIIYYFYTYRQINDTSIITKKKEKYTLINTKKSVLKNHTKFTNILFYINDFKYLNIPQFNILTSQIESFCNTFESCMTDFKLINKLYNTLIQLKINILISINTISYSLKENIAVNKMDRVKDKMENVINEYIKIIIDNYNKNIYYNGYNNGTKIIDNTNIIPNNSFYVHDFKINNFDFSNLLFLT